MTPDVVVHANAGNDVGLGHLVRCMTLVRELLSRGVAATLRIEDDPDAVAFAHDEGVEPKTSTPATLHEDLLTSPGDVVVIDSYEFTSEDFDRLTGTTTLVVFDELGDRRLPADLVINNNIYANDIAYPTADVVCRGPDYCLLRPAFRDLPAPEHTQPPRQVLLTVGGSDLAGAFEDVLEMTARAVPAETTVKSVVGPYFETPPSPPSGVTFHRVPSNMAELMWTADFAVSGGGQTLYELAACGTPPVAVTLGDDQIRNVEAFEAAGAARGVGRPAAAEFESRLHNELSRLYETKSERRQLAERCRDLVDGFGAERVANRVETLI